MSRLPGTITVASRSVRQTRGVPLCRRSTASIASIRCGWSSDPASTPRTRLECGSVPSSTYAVPPPRRGPPLEPVPPDLLTRRMRDLDRLPAGHPRAGLAVRPQPGPPQLPGETDIRQPVAQRHHLIEQRVGPQVRIIGEPRRKVGRKRCQWVGLRGHPAAGLPFPGQVGRHSLMVTANMAGDRRDRPPASCQCMYLHVFSLCEHRAGAPSNDGLDTVRLEGAPPQSADVSDDTPRPIN